MDPPLQLLAAFQTIYPDKSPNYIVQAPGRAMWVAAAMGPPDNYCIHVVDLDRHTRFSWRSARSRQTLLKRPLPAWARYPAGVVVDLSGAGIDVSGVCAVILGQEMPGPRYDYALGVTFAALWHTLADKPYTGETIIEVVERVRREYVEI